MIKVLKKNIVKAKQKASLYHVVFACDDAKELPTPAQYNGWIIDMGSVAHVINTGETYTLNSEGKWILQKKNESEGVTFTEADKEKLDSLTNPIMLKDRVDTVGDLQKIENPKIGWLYFVGYEGAEEFAEYIFTEAKKWEFIGFNNIDLSGYVQKTEYNSKVNRFESDISALHASQQEQNDKIEVNKSAQSELSNKINILTNNVDGLKIVTGTVQVNRAEGHNEIFVPFEGFIFSSAPKILATQRSDNPEKYHISVKAVTTTGFYVVCFNNSTAMDTPINVDYIAIGVSSTASTVPTASTLLPNDSILVSIDSDPKTSDGVEMA